MRHGRRSPTTLVGVAGAVDGGRPGHPAGQRLRRAGQGGRGGRLLLLQRRQTPPRGARLHQPLPLHPPQDAPPGRAVGRLPPAVHPRRWPSPGRRPEELPGGAGVVLHPRHRGHRRLRLHRAGDRRAAGGPHRRLPGRRLPQHLDEQRAGAVGDHRPLAGRHAAALRLPVLEGPGCQTGHLARRRAWASPCSGGTSSPFSSSSWSSRWSSWPGRSAGSAASPSSGSPCWPPRSSSRPGSGTT